MSCGRMCLRHAAVLLVAGLMGLTGCRSKEVEP